MSISSKGTFLSSAARSTAMAVLLGMLTQTGCTTSHRSGHDGHDHPSSHRHGAAGDAAHPGLATPQVIVIEHEHLHHQLDAAIASGGKTGERAREVAEVLASHFEQEEAYAMPPLGLLEPLAWNKPVDGATAAEAIKMADHLRDEYDNMLHEHEMLTAALHRLASAARQENKPQHAEFAEALIMHAQHEEQVLYPATLMIGEYLKLKRSHEPAAHGH